MLWRKARTAGTAGTAGTVGVGFGLPSPAAGLLRPRNLVQQPHAHGGLHKADRRARYAAITPLRRALSPGLVAVATSAEQAEAAISGEAAELHTVFQLTDGQLGDAVTVGAMVRGEHIVVGLELDTTTQWIGFAGEAVATHRLSEE